jgi:hypothetical protein
VDGWTTSDLINPSDINFFNYDFRHNGDSDSRGYLDGNEYKRNGKS